MIIISLYIIPNLGLTKTSDLMFIRCHSTQLEPYRVVMKKFVYAPSWHDDVCTCSLTVLYRIHYIIHNYVVIFFLMVRAYFCPYTAPSLIRGLCPRINCAFLYLLPLSPRWILSCLLLSTLWIRLFILLSPCCI